MNKTITQISKESRLENLLTLKRAICNNSFEDLSAPDNEWGGAYVIITSSNEKIKNTRTDNDTFVVTRHSLILSKLFWYVKENIMYERDFHLYGFMALLANDFIKEFGDINNYNLLLGYVTSGISFYYQLYGKFDKFKLMRFFLSPNISDEDIKHIL